MSSCSSVRTPVSYTHLDVYKRQSEERLRGEIGQVEERLRVEFHSKLETEIHASEERTRTGIQEEIRASEDRLRGEMGQVEDRLRTEFQSKLETEIRASEERLRTE